MLAGAQIIKWYFKSRNGDVAVWSGWLLGCGGDDFESGSKQHCVHGRQQRAAATTVQHDLYCGACSLALVEALPRSIRPLRTVPTSRPLPGQRCVTHSLYTSQAPQYLHCCKAHAKSNRQMGNSTPCNRTPLKYHLETLHTWLCRRGYPPCKFWFQSVQWGLLPK